MPNKPFDPGHERLVATVEQDLTSTIELVYQEEHMPNRARPRHAVIDEIVGLTNITVFICVSGRSEDIVLRHLIDAVRTAILATPEEIHAK